MAASTYSQHPSQPQSYHGSSIASAPNAPPGTFLPGTLITVGAHKCTIDRYLSEGGFAHVYLVKLDRPADGTDVAVLKRVAVPDKEALASMRTEVETMKKLKGHRHIVTYIDSHASHLKGGGYEVFLLMEYCSGGGLIDFMNTRLQNRLTEPEVLNIFGDVAEGVACMHYLQPPLLHRDLKVENVLIGSHRGYKLCDFGSCSPVRPAPQTAMECRLVEEDIQKHTTLQYRSPEMIDVYRKLPIDEKSDIWALGVLLYKLCYYTTPFEEQGQLAILNASFKFPSYPLFSDRLRNLIASMLRESPQLRPNIYLVVREVCLMRRRDIPIKDIYSTSAQNKPAEKHFTAPQVHSSPSVIAYQSPPPPQQAPIPDVTPMRRGRPTKSSSVHSAATSRTRAGESSPQIRAVSTDPFSALDNRGIVGSSQDEIFARFPSVEQFSLLHDSGNKFEFGESLITPMETKKDLNTRLTEKLADEVFAPPPQPAPRPVEGKMYEGVSRGITGTPAPRPVLHEPEPTRPVMVSTGTMTGTMTSPSPSASPTPSPLHEYPSRNPEPALRPSSSREPISGIQALVAADALLGQQRPNLLDIGRSATHASAASRTPNSSRPSLDVPRASSSLDNRGSNSPNRSKSVNTKPRPNSTFIESNIDFLRDLDSANNQGLSASSLPFQSAGLMIQQSITGQSINSQRSEHIESNVDFLRAMETESDAAKPEKKATSGGFKGKHAKRASMPSISLPNAKSLLSGKFGDAFRRFERNNTGGYDTSRTPSPDMDRAIMPTITGSHTTSEIGDDWEVSSQDVPPEMKRELEKRRLSQEEKRVAAAAAEYKRQVADRVPGEGAAGKPSSSRNRANSIQNKVKALLSENRAPAPKTAEGYGRYTDEIQQQRSGPTNRSRAIVSSEKPNADVYTHSSLPNSRTVGYNRPGTATMDSSRTNDPLNEIRPITSTGPASKIVRKVPGSTTVITSVSTEQSISTATPTSSSRPNPPPKPNKLRTGGGNSTGPSQPSPSSSLKPDERDVGGANGSTDEDWQKNFAKRYPSLSGLEMVESIAGRKS
ncbi:Ark- serine/threonine protein kinase [Rhizina undulata]